MFDYTKIPDGHYDKIFDKKNGMRKFWHYHKFDAVARSIEKYPHHSLLDIGCFAGTFLGRFCTNSNTEYIGVDILSKQIQYANYKYGQDNKKFILISHFDDLQTKVGDKTFEIITFIEVIEHLNEIEINSFFNNIDKLTKSGSHIIITTPNYTSLWPVLEFIINVISDVNYTEQHITKFNIFNIENKLSLIYSDFNDKYRVIYKTTTHLLSPYISIFNYNIAQKISQAVQGEKWKLPFGSMILLHLEKK